MFVLEWHTTVLEFCPQKTLPYKIALTINRLEELVWIRQDKLKKKIAGFQEVHAGIVLKDCV